MRKSLLILGIAALAGATAPTRALGDGEEVVVVYNSRLPQSKALADYYAEMRQVPRGQVFGFDLTTNETISRIEFRDGLQRPLAAALQSGKLWRLGAAEVMGTNGKPSRVENSVVESKIRYAALCYGVPLRILNDPNFKEPGGEAIRPELRRNEAAVDSELALLPLIEQKLPISGLLRNPVYSWTNEAALNPTNGVLMVTRLDGPTPEIARGLVDKAIQAEREGLWGRAYFDLRGTTDPNLKPGDDWIRSASEICRHLGFETVVDEGEGTFPASFPMSQIAIYMGWYTGEASGPFSLPEVEFMPGAFAYHLHSSSAASLRTTNQYWAGPLLAKGATITMGCVNEPYLAGTPDVGVFTARLIYLGFTFGESAYAAQSVLSWQTTVVGDPLYRPFGKAPQLQHLELVARKSRFVEWSHLRVADVNLANGIPLAEVVSYLERTDATKQSAVLTEKLGDLYAALGKPSSAVFACQQALKLDPSPQQRIRLRLTLGERLSALGRDEEAYENYQALLAQAPGYPDSLSIYRKLGSLAEKLGRKEDAAKYEREIKRLLPPPARPPAPRQ